MSIPRSLPLALSVAVAAGLVLARPACAQGEVPGADEPLPLGEWERHVSGGPGPSEPDVFHPERDAPVEPRRGGTARVHLTSQPKHVNYMTENSATTRRILREVHETLLSRNWETWELEPVLAERWVSEDTLILAGGRGPDGENIHWGRVSEEGDAYVVTPLSDENPLEEPLRVPKDQVESVQRETVFTFVLREGVTFHDGHPLDADDVLFSFSCYRNPHVDCEHVRFRMDRFEGVEKLDARTLRFFYGEQYFQAAETFDSLIILPRHVYDLRDPDHPQHDPDATDEELGRYVNEHPANRMWVGLGPYRVTAFDAQNVEAERYDGYFDPANGGYVDRIRWVHVADDETAKVSLMQGNLDYWERLRPEDYYGEFTRRPAFTERFYKGLASFNYCGYTTWNTRRKKLSDPAVREALNLCFDWDTFIRDAYYGLASRVTGTTYYFAPHYDRTLEPVPYDPVAAEDLLLDAGWYDRDGDGVVDKDGEPLTIQFLMPTGNKAAEVFAQKLQEDLAKVGVRLDIAEREWATFLEQILERDFDAASLAWITPVVSDPYQIWHSSMADQPRSSNHSGVEDEEVDRLLEAIQVELDDARRAELFARYQRRVYELHPYLFGVTIAKKFAVARRVRNFRTYAIDPGYRIREWFLVEDAAGGGGAGSGAR